MRITYEQVSGVWEADKFRRKLAAFIDGGRNESLGSTKEYVRGHGGRSCSRSQQHTKIQNDREINPQLRYITCCALWLPGFLADSKCLVGDNGHYLKEPCEKLSLYVWRDMNAYRFARTETKLGIVLDKGFIKIDDNESGHLESRTVKGFE